MGSQACGWHEGGESLWRSAKDGGCNTWFECTTGESWNSRPVERPCANGAIFKDKAEIEKMFKELIGHWCDKAGAAYNVTRNEGEPHLRVQIWKSTGNEASYTLHLSQVVGGSFQVVWGTKANFTLNTSLPKKGHTLSEVAWTKSSGGVTHTWTRDA